MICLALPWPRPWPCAALVLLTGCAAIPDRATPDLIPRPDQIRERVFTTPLQASVLPEVASPEPHLSLDDILAVARAENPTFKEFEANRAAARAEIVASFAHPNPEIELGISWSDPRDPASETAREYSIALTQPLEWPAQRRARRRAAVVGLDVVEHEAEAFRVALRAEVTTAFWRVLFEEQRLLLAEENASIAEDLCALIERRAATGEAAAIEHIRARVESWRAVRLTQAQRREIATARAVLNALCGGALPGHYRLDGALPRSLPPADGREALAQALSHHPAIRRIETLRLQREAELAGARAARLPAPAPGVLIEREADAHTAGATLSVEIPLWDRNQGGVARAEAALQQVDAELARARVEIERGVLVALEAYQAAREQTAAFEGGLRADAARVLETERFLFDQGEADLLQMLDARRVAQETEAEALQAAFDLARSRADLEAALGIGE